MILAMHGTEVTNWFKVCCSYGCTLRRPMLILINLKECKVFHDPFVIDNTYFTFTTLFTLTIIQLKVKMRENFLKFQCEKFW